MIVSGYVVLVFSDAAAAQGAFNFDEISGVDQEPAIAIDLNEPMLNFIRDMATRADPAAETILTGLRSIRLRVYHNGDNARRFSNFIDDVTEELEDTGWMAVVKTQDESSKVRVHMQMTEQQISGMTFMFTDGTEAVFINIDGAVSAEDLGAVLATLAQFQPGLGLITVPPATAEPDG